MPIISRYNSKLVTILVIVLFLCGGFGLRHPLHVSTTEANYNLKQKSLEISCAIFTDDFEGILSKNYKQKIDLINPSMHKKMDELINNYITTHLLWKINGKMMQPKYLGYEIDHEAVNVFFEIEGLPILKSIETSNTLLYDLFNDQISILHLTKGSIRKSTKLGYPEKNFTATFN